MPRLTRSKITEAWEAFTRDKPEAIAVDTETTGVGWYHEAFCMTVAWENEVHYLELSDRDANRVAIRMLRTPKLVFHNAKFDLQKLLLAGLLRRSDLTPDRIEDTLCIAHLLNPHDVKGLKELARSVLGLETDEADVVRKAKADMQKQYKKEHGKVLYAKDIDYSMLPRRAVYPYALKDTVFTWQLWKALKPRLHDTLPALYEREMALTLVLLDIEAAGMAVDIDYVDREIKRKNGEILGCELQISDTTGMPVWYPERPGQKQPEGTINPNSGAQIMSVYADKGVTLADTKETTLKTMTDEFASTILALRGKKKLLSTYLLSIKHDSRDGIMHPGYRQFEAKTGRMSSSGKGD